MSEMSDTSTPEPETDQQPDTPEAGDSHNPEAVCEQTELQRLASELKAANDRALRTQADLDNFRKRSRREMDDQRRYADLPLLRDLLPVVDNLDRAVQAAEQNHDAASLLEGVKMVVTQFSSVLTQHHCQPIEADGAAFDPNLHEAISQSASGDHPAGNIVHVAQAGYQLHDRVVRPSQVIVSLGVQDSDEAET